MSANPLVYEVMWKAAAMVKSPNNASETIYDEWLRSSKKVYNGIFRPEITNLGSGSDYTMFLQSQGISCGDVSYVRLFTLGSQCNVLLVHMLLQV